MNFLSHYYFDQQEIDSHVVIGLVLPDFIKNAHKDWNLNPQKQEHLFLHSPGEAAILKGWKRHLEVDRLFHGSDFFTSQTAELKQLILPALQSGPVKPFFLAHIGLELILDHLLTTRKQVNINQFYTQLNEANSDSLQSFLRKAGVSDMDLFMKFLDGFISSRYLLSYRKIENITYALNRICMRLWHEPFTPGQLEQLTESLLIYRDTITPDYMSIYTEIENKL